MKKKFLQAALAIVIGASLTGCLKDSSPADGVVETSGEVDVYVVGQNDDDQAVYWKNGEMIELETDGMNWAIAGAIAVSGEDVYIAGRGWYKSDDNIAASYWKNGRITRLPFLNSSNLFSSADAIAVSGNDVYITGHDGGDAVYWKNGEIEKLGNEDEKYHGIAVVPRNQDNQ
ncbi:MAG: hypothetical protein LBP64_04555 [Tannerella sp.]|nr:hypothetical protein [Tannerella sp.]